MTQRDDVQDVDVEEDLKHQWTPAKRAKLTIALVLVSLFSAAQAQTAVTVQPPNLSGGVAGVLAGSASVSPSGGSSYSVPIALPPGTAGMTPSVSLSYSSQGGTGLLGHGWNIGGLSMITRCAKNIVPDGVKRAVQLKAEDQFCMDGQRLLLVSGTHGASAQYRTEIDGFARIISSGSDTAKGPDSWTVTTKGGMTLVFGGTTDSTIEAQGKTTVLSWSLSKAHDRRGNFYSVHYSENNATGEFYPVRIRYTGNASAGLLPYNAVNFIYETRPDLQKGHVAGALVSRTQRLLAIQTRVNTSTVDGTGGSLVRDYRVGYATNPVNGRSLVSTITDCDGAGNCLPATSFSWTTRDASANTFTAAGSGDWGGPSVSFGDTTLNGSKDVQVKTQVVLGDFDGDGATDLVRGLGNGVWKVCLARSTTFSCQDWSGPAVPTRDAVTGDFNGDGRTDIAVYPKTDGPGSWTMCLSTGTSLSCSAWAGRGVVTQTTQGEVKGTLVGDFNGDGRDDIAIASWNYGEHICRSTGSGFEGGANCLPYPGSANFVHYAALFSEGTIQSFAVSQMGGDVDGDGRTDYVQLVGWREDSSVYPPGSWQGIRATDTGFVGFGGSSAGKIKLNYEISSGGNRFTDHNGDPYESYGDVVSGFGAYGSDPAKLEVCRSTSTALSCKTLAGINTSNYAVRHVGDSDGDGRPDFYVGSKVCQLDANDNFTCADWTRALTITATGPVSTFMGDFNGDGRIDSATYYESSGRWIVGLAGHGGFPDLLQTVTNGVGHQTEFVYKGLHDGSVYTKGSDVAYPKRNIVSFAPVVSQLKTGNGQGGWFLTNYKYLGLRADSQGRGMLGFEQVTSIDDVTKVTHEARYSQDYPYTGMTTSAKSTQANGVVLNESTSTLAHFATTSGALYPYVSSSTVTTRDLNGAAMSTATSAINADGIDAWGNVKSSTDTLIAGGETFTTSVSNTYDNDSINWRLGELRRTTTTRSAPGVASVTRTASSDYNSIGEVIRETVEPDDITYRVTTDYEREASFGLLTKKTVSWRDPASGTDKTRVVERLEYDAKKRFVTKAYNAKDHAEDRTYDDAYGNLLTLTGPNALTTSWQYDGFGRKTREDRADGTASTFALRKCVDQCLNGAVVVSITQNWAGAAQTTVPSESFADSLGRSVFSRTWGFDGTPIINDLKQFNASGWLVQAARPHFAGASPVWTTYEHDALGRTIKVNSPNQDGTGVDTSFVTYDGLRTATQNAKGQTRTEWRNGLGKLKSVADAYSYTTSYLYDPFGNVVRTTDQKGNQIKVTYDRLGRKTRLEDPDLGTWNYHVDPLGQTWKQVDAKLQETKYTFDDIGRMTRRLEPDLDSYWIYDTATKGIGKLAEAYTWAGGVKDVRREHTYDNFGRAKAVATTLDQLYETQFGYDPLGRLTWQCHYRLTLTRSASTYNCDVTDTNAYGYVHKLSLYIDGAYRDLWSGLQMDAEGRITKQQLANGIKTDKSYNPRTGRLESINSGPDNAGAASGSHQKDTYRYDSIGNLTSRSHLIATSGALMSESFTYDSLNRLASSQVAGKGAKNYGYDEIGNLTSMSGFPPSTPPAVIPIDDDLFIVIPGKTSGTAQANIYSYPTSGAVSTRPHAVSSILGTLAGVVNPTFSYDGNGNMLNGMNRAYAWTSYNQPKDIDRLNAGAAVQRTSFVYGPEHQRVRQTVSPLNGGNGGAPARTIYYAGAIEKEIDTAAGTTTIRTLLPMGLGYLEERLAGASVGPAASATRNPRYFLKDHLGSPNAVVDQAQTVLQRMSYDAWGRRRNTDGSDDTASSIAGIANNQDHAGYTGHETLDQLGLVHMNARLYDPIVGRHVTADPTVPNPHNGQAYNRYSYVLNNPLAYTDPSGLAPSPVFSSLSAPRFNFPGQGAIGWQACKAHIDRCGVIDWNDEGAGARARLRDILMRDLSEGAQDGGNTGESPGSQVGGLQVQTLQRVEITAKSQREETASSAVGGGRVFRTARDLLDDTLTGGYGQRAEAARRQGSWGWWVAHNTMGAAYGIANVVTLGSGSLLSKLGTTATSKVVSTTTAEVVAAKGVSVASGVGRDAPMRVERVIQKGEKVADLVNEAKALTFTSGNEHAVVTLANGERALVSGGPGGITFSEGSISRIFGHTHPTNAPPSAADAEALRALGQSKQYVFHGGAVSVVRPSH